MKLGKVLKYIDDMTSITIWYADAPDKVFKMINLDFPDDCPKWLKKYHLIKPKYNDDSQAICPYHKVNEHGATLDYIRITVIKEK